MIYCINPKCKQRQNPDDSERCLYCGTELLIERRFRLIKPLRPLDFRYNTEIFEVVDDKGIHKVMKILKSQESKEIELLERETLTLQLFDHPGIPRVIDDLLTVIPEKSYRTLHCLVMQKFEGQDLEEWAKGNGKISQTLALNWLIQLVKILDEVHRSGFFHRDIKPSNIILQPDGQLGLIDFGAVRQVTGTYLTKVSGSGGNDMGLGHHEITALVTPGFTPLEQINGQALPQSDFYALGRTLAYLVTGTHVINLPTDPKTTRLIWRNKARQIENPFADLLDELMAPAPGKRPPSTQVLLQRLERLPFESKINRVIQSKQFKIGVCLLGLLSGAGLIYASLPVVANYYLNEGKKAYQENRLDDARDDFKKAVNWNYRLNDLVANYLLNQGKKAHQENRFPDAEIDFQTAIIYNPNLTYSISQFYFEQAERRGIAPDVAKKYYDLAINFNPKDVGIYNNLALLCQDLGDEKCVKNSYKTLFKLKPNAWEGHYGLGSFYDERAEYELAQIQYKLAIENSNRDAQPLNNLARLKNISGDYNAAVALALEGLKKTKDSQKQATLYKNLGWAKLGQKKYSKAKEYLEKAIDLDSKRTDAYCLLAQVNEALGEINHARISWEVCLVAESNQLEVQQWRKQVLKRLLGDIVPGSSP